MGKGEKKVIVIRGGEKVNLFIYLFNSFDLRIDVEVDGVFAR